VHPAVLAARGNDLDLMAGGRRRPDGVLQIVFDVSASQAQFAGNRGHRSRLVRQQIDQVPPEHHGSIL